MAETPEIDASQGRVITVLSRSSDSINMPQGRVSAVINFPTASMRSSQAQVRIIANASNLMLASQAQVLVVAKGRTANPHIRVWTFTLDGHDFYVLRLGDSETLIYDVSTEQWIDWDSGNESVWRPNTGMSWIGGQVQASTYGSNIVAGDDTWGLLWFLDPEQPFDEHADYTNPRQQIEFDRVVMGQFAVKGREVQPCYAIFLDGDNYGITAMDFTPGVKLEYSDDAGKTYDNAGTIGVTVDSVDQVYEWLSLGQISSPGRLFKITDNGVFTRIDGMTMNDN